MSAWRQAWDTHGVTLTHADEPSVTLDQHAVAALNDYDAVMYGLPQLMEAVIVVRIEGRIDHPAFRAAWRIEPLASPHAWMVHRREGARLFVGTRVLRLNAHQYALCEALEAMEEAGADIAARLRAWPALVRALHAPQHARIVLQGVIPAVHIQQVQALPPGAMTRQDGRLQPVAGHALWAMQARHRYFLPLA